MTDVTFVSVEFACELLGELKHQILIAVRDIAGAEQERGDLTPLIDSEVKFKSEEPAHATFPPCGNTLEYPMLPDAFVVTDVKGRAVYEIC